MNEQGFWEVGPQFLLILLAWAAGWLSLSALLSYVSGWQALAKHYSSGRPFLGRIWNFRSATMRYACSFRACLKIGSDSLGIYAAVFFPFRFRHPPLFIPWEDVRIRRVKSRWARGGEYWDFRFNRIPTIPFQLSRKLGEEMIRVSGREFPPAWI